MNKTRISEAVEATNDFKGVDEKAVTMKDIADQWLKVQIKKAIEENDEEMITGIIQQIGIDKLNEIAGSIYETK